MTKINEKIKDGVENIAETKSVISDIAKTLIPLVIKEITKTTSTKDIMIDILKCIAKDDVKEIRECIISVINQYELEYELEKP